MSSNRTNFRNVGILNQIRVASATATATAGAATAHAQIGTITSESLTTAAGGTYTLTITNNHAATSSVVLANARLGTSTQGTPQVVGCVPNDGSVVVSVRNIHATQAFNGTIRVDFLILNPT